MKWTEINENERLYLQTSEPNENENEAEQLHQFIMCGVTVQS